VIGQADELFMRVPRLHRAYFMVICPRLTFQERLSVKRSTTKAIRQNQAEGESFMQLRLNA
jgi:hypothetical protein